ncbi:MAG TPA: PAS domain S-box protein [Acidimicrobiales bacterium]|nr:PAS domain S-box protein [Acidimicrobiales bacterium]
MTDPRVEVSRSSAEPGQLLGAIFATSPDAVVVVDDTGTIVLSNPSVTELFGYYPEELIGASVATLLPLGRREAHAAHLTGFFAAPHPRQMGVGQNLAGRRRDGHEFPVDVSLAPVEVRGRQYVAAFVRDGGERQRAISRLDSVNEITQQLLSGAGASSIFPEVAARARWLSHSEAVWIVLPGDDGELRIAYADGPGADVLVGVPLSPESSRSAEVMRTGSSEMIEDLSTATNVPPQCAALDLGPGLYTPLVAEHRRLGTLVFGRVHGAERFSTLDVAFAEVFASSVATAIVLAESRSELERLGIVAEEERIARDLHDTVIQQLFALGMSLQATRATLSGEVAERLDDAVDRIDEVIREIRNTIFRLPARGRADSGLRDDVLRVVESHREGLGFAPRIAFEGPVDTAVPRFVADHVVQVVGEALTNVARHAQASLAEVVVTVGDGTLTVIVLDDGKGVADSPSAGNGVRNMASRASELGGAARLVAREPRGTVLEWRVPL